MNIRQSTTAYETWLRARLRGDVVASALKAKHTLMREHPFAFLRGSYWRWAETILTVCPELATPPKVLAVGDIHLENFGTWRDLEGRLVFGINDFDEAAEMPYLIDLVRLAVSAHLGAGHLSLGRICAGILEGYGEGVEDPEPLVLDVRAAWLRKAFEVKNGDRNKFWDKARPEHPKNRIGTPSARYRRALQAALDPDDNKVSFTTYTREAGLGSLGRPRWVGYGDWRSAPLIREAKAMVPSSWTRAHGGSTALRAVEIARGTHRSPDPWYHLHGGVLVRRLSPNNRKLELGRVETASLLLDARMLRVMGRDLAAAHLGTGNRRKAVARDLERRKPGQLREWAEAAEAQLLEDYEAYGGN